MCPSLKRALYRLASPRLATLSPARISLPFPRLVHAFGGDRRLDIVNIIAHNCVQLCSIVCDPHRVTNGPTVSKALVNGWSSESKNESQEMVKFQKSNSVSNATQVKGGQRYGHGEVMGWQREGKGRGQIVKDQQNTGMSSPRYGNRVMGQ